MKIEQCQKRKCPELRYNHLRRPDECKVIRYPISEILICPLDPTLRAPEHGTIQTFGDDLICQK